MTRPLSDTRLGRIVIWPAGMVLQIAWFLFCVLGVIGAWINIWVLSIRDWWKGKRK